MLIISVIIGLVVLSAFSAKYFLEKKAIQVAQGYLLQKYEQEMQYLSIRFSWIDPALYHVYFSPIDNPDLVFEVIVQQDIRLKESSSRGKYDFMPDNYNIAYFEFKMEQVFLNDVNRIWADHAVIRALYPNPALYAFGIPHGFNEKMTLKEMAILFDDYLFIVSLDTILDNESKTREASRIFDFIQTVQEDGYKPNTIAFWYNFPKGMRTKSGRIKVDFDNWQDISTVHQVLEQMKF